jgi:tRNA A-37 threonylcarbamoyl transferase component Bud32
MKTREWRLSLLRTGRTILRLEIPGYRGIFDRRLAPEQGIAEFVRGLDALMQAGQVLKKDRASFVSRVLWNGQDAVVKRYNHRDLWHSFRYTIKGSRARRNWLNAHQLLSLQIATPEPLGYVECYRGPLLWQSYFVARFVRGTQVHEILRDAAISVSQRQRINDMVLTLLHVMAKHGVSHGDMKHTNILYDGTNVVLTDLDAMRIGGTGWLWQHRCRRDVNRYLRDLANLSMPIIPPRDAG